MTRRARLPHKPHHISIYDEDWELLMSYFGPHGLHPGVGVSETIREIVHRKCAEYRARANAQLDARTPAPAQEPDTIEEAAQ